MLHIGSRREEERHWKPPLRFVPRPLWHTMAPPLRLGLEPVVVVDGASRHGVLAAASSDASCVVVGVSPLDICVHCAEDGEKGARIVEACVEPLNGLPRPTKVTALACVDVAPLAGRPGFTCICLGFDTGELRFLRKTGEFLFGCRPHGSEVRTVRPRDGCELTVLHQNALVLVDGSSLMGVLHTCARQAETATVPWGPGSVLPAAASRQLSLPSSAGSDQVGTIADACCCGAPPTSPLESDQRMTDALCFVLAAGGARVFLLTALAPDERSSSVAHIAADTASAIFSAAKGLLWGREVTAAPDGEALAAALPPTPLDPVRAISDQPRAVHGMCVHPTGSWAAVADNLGRVVVVDVPSLILRRMWRGYRDAEMAWVSAPEEEDHGEAAAAGRAASHEFLLLIYAPRRGLLEVWPMPVGKRLASLDVGTDGHLVYGSMPVTGDRPLRTEHACLFLSAAGEMQRVRLCV